MGRSPCCDEHGLKKGPWTPEEDEKLIQHIHEHGHGSWRALPKLAGLNRCGKSCRLRWTNYLRPDIKRGKFTQEEEHTILNLHSLLGNKWSAIAGHLPGRTDNEIKNFWNTHLKKKLIQMGFDPVTHRPRTDLFSNLTHLIALAKLREMMDQHIWEAEAVELARVQYLQQLLQPTTEISNSSNSLNNITTMEAISILNSLAPSYKETICILNSLAPSYKENMAFSSHPLGDQAIFSQLEGLQVDLKPPMNNKINQVAENLVFFNEEITANSQIVTTTSLTEHSIGYNGDACSSSSNGVGDPYFWPVIIEDPLFHDII